MADIELALRLNGSIDLRRLAEAAGQLMTALAEIEERATNTHAHARWAWDEEPILRLTASPNGLTEPTLQRVVRDLGMGFQQLSAGKQRDLPDTVGPKARGAINKILGYLNELESITYEASGVQPIEIPNATITTEVGQLPGLTSEIGEIDGVLDLISGRKGLAFWIQEHGTTNRIRCAIDAEMALVAARYIQQRVRVVGLINYRPNGTPMSLFYVRTIELVPDPTLDLEQLYGSMPGLTGELSAEEYVRRLREDVGEPE